MIAKITCNILNVLNNITILLIKHSMNTACVFYYYQSEIPEEANAYRKAK